MPYDDFARSFSAKYELFLFALAGRYLSDAAAGVVASPMSISALREDAGRFAQTFYSAAEADVAQYVTDSGDGDPVRALLFKAWLRQALTENVNQVLLMAKGGRRDFAKLIRAAHGSFGSLIQSKASEVDFRLRDPAGRRWVAARLVQLFARDFAYQSWLDKSFAELTAAGTDIAIAVRRGEAGAPFSISGDSTEFPSLASVRSTVFHFNSSAVPAPYVPT